MLRCIGCHSRLAALLHVMKFQLGMVSFGGQGQVALHTASITFLPLRTVEGADLVSCWQVAVAWQLQSWQGSARRRRATRVPSALLVPHVPFAQQGSGGGPCALVGDFAVVASPPAPVPGFAAVAHPPARKLR
jgi:hypothetical protein